MYAFSLFILQIFFVLRKKQRQITFLHIYHHAGMVSMVYIHMKFFSGGGHGLILGIVNLFVHSIMYAYYLATSLKIKMDNQERYKKRITQIQMVWKISSCTVTVP
jgi:GNS1/SUR4 family